MRPHHLSSPLCPTFSSPLQVIIHIHNHGGGDDDHSDNHSNDDHSDNHGDGDHSGSHHSATGPTVTLGTLAAAAPRGQPAPMNAPTA